MSRPVGQREVERRATVSEGQIEAPLGLRNLKGRKLLLSAAVTSSAIGNGKGSAATWQTLSDTLGVFTAARYRRPSATAAGTDRSESQNGFDETALDAALAEAQYAVRRLWLTQWRRFPRSRPRKEAAMARQSWAR